MNDLMRQKGSSEMNQLGLLYEEEKNTSSQKSRENGLLIIMSDILHRPHKRKVIGGQ
jgi:hypothetical protein